MVHVSLLALLVSLLALLVTLETSRAQLLSAPYLLTGTRQFTCFTRDSRDKSRAAPLCALLAYWYTSVYLLYSYKSTNTDTYIELRTALCASPCISYAVYLLYCTKVQILTQKALRGSS
jgi:hypothetical protein